MLKPLRQRNFALLFSGQTVSELGDGIFTVALALEALRISHGPLLLSFVIAARTVPMLVLLLPAGALTDRMPRRMSMLASDAVRGASVAVAGALIVADALHPAELVVMAVIFGSADAFFFPASTAIVPEIVEGALLTEASSLSFTSQLLAGALIGPAIGGVLVGAIGTAGCFFVDAGTFAASALALGLMRRMPQQDASERGSMLVDTVEGLRFTFQRSNRWLWVTLVAAGLANFCSFTPLTVLMPLLVERTLHGSPAQLGYVLAAGGLGGLCGVFVAGKRGAPVRRVAWMWTAWISASLFVLLRAFTPNLWLLAAMAFASGGLLYYGSTIWTPLMQELVPRELLGRVSSVDWLFSLSLSPIGVIAAGGLAAEIGVRWTLFVGGTAGLLSGAVIFIPGVLDPDRERVTVAKTDRVERGSAG